MKELQDMTNRSVCHEPFFCQMNELLLCSRPESNQKEWFRIEKANIGYNSNCAQKATLNQKVYPLVRI